ncbi:AcrR family transcriptional regulator [Catenibacillus scindens]|uniref:AcrR family transcriptional regulator n=1 Tax=Catenibacillus scindens TaxID=673271 RepID=A0A7W8HA96_9FIRM|nr:TetR/AcrR family transcriptional regulator [Catenibacillus scindens]MBB5264771.1 AcrR family transcriptional regulator [Catenibacillus scindens]
MPNTEKYENILDALQKLLQSKDIKMITVSEIAQAAGIGKGSLYYYFPSKEAVLEALIARTYEKPMEIATTLADQKEISSFTRMAMIFQACRNASLEFSKQKDSSSAGIYEGAYIHQMFLNHVITGLKGTLAQIIRQGIQEGQITFEDPEALAEIVLIVLTVKLDNTIVPSTQEDVEKVMRALVSLLEKGTDNPMGSLNFLLAF